MSVQYDCLEGSDLAKLLAKLDEMALEGWELVSSHAVHALGKTTHYLFLRRPTPSRREE